LVFITFADCIFKTLFYFVVNLALAIKELILLKEGVILPGLGGFVTQYHPAEIQKSSNTFAPPSIELSFDTRMVTDNGLLISHIARKKRLSEEDARKIVSDYVERIKKEIQEKGSVLIEEVGTLSRGTGGNLSFRAASDKNYNVRSFGLPAIEIPAPAKPVENAVKTPVKPPVPVVRQKQRKIPVLPIILAIVVIGTGAIYFTGLFDTYIKPLLKPSPVASVTKTENQNKIVFGQQVAEEDSSDAEISRQLSDNSSQEKALLYQEKETEKTPITKPKTEQATTVKPAMSSATPSAAYYVVAGSFLIPGNAERQKEQLQKKGYSPLIIQKNNEFFYVTLQSFDTEEKAMNEMKQLTSQLHLPLWVLKK